MKRIGLIWCLVCVALWVLVMRPVSGYAEGLPIGSTLSSFVLPVPATQEEMNYLGLKERAPFSLSQVSAKLILIEVVNAL